MTAEPGSSRILTRALAAETRRRLYGFCGYCGRPCQGQTCGYHRDLVALDVGTPIGFANALNYSTAVGGAAFRAGRPPTAEEVKYANPA